MAGSKTQPHATGSKKLKYSIESTHPGWSGVCQETESQQPPLDPCHHLPPNTSYTIFPKEAGSGFWTGNQARTFLVQESSSTQALPAA